MKGKTLKNAYLKALAAALIALASSQLMAASGYENDDPTTWNWPFPFILSGDESIDNQTCVIWSNNGNNRTLRYRIRMRDSDSVGFVLEQTSPGTSGRLPIELIWNDPTAGNFTLVDNVEESTRFRGNLQGSCTSVSTLRVNITEFDYLSVPAGNYYDVFQLRARSNSNSITSVIVDVDVPEFVRVSFPMGDIAVPFSTTVDQLVVEQFCIYTNASNASVGVAIGVQNNDDDGNHSVLDSGADQIDYSFEFRTAGGGITLGTINTESGMAEVSTTNADTQSNICAVSGNTHEFAVSVNAVDMAAASAGSYSDTITVYVEPAL
jgi:hypothetical protein